MDSKYINIAPSNLFLKVGEVKQIQVNCDFEQDSWSLKIEPEGIVEVDKFTKDIRGLKVGYCKITAILHHIQKDGRVVEDSETMTVEVQEGEAVATPIKIMLHNRQTNRMVTMVGDMTDEECIIKLPNTNGTLLTEEAVEDLQSVIATPSIVNVTHYEPNWNKEFEGSDFMLRLGNTTETHIASEWEFSLDEHFNEVIVRVKHETGDLKKCGHELFGLKVWVRVRYISENYISAWSKSVNVMLTSDTPADKLRTLRKGDNINGGYYGNITHDQLVDSYDYRGVYNTLVAYNLKEFKKGQQVFHNDKLWYAKVQMDTNTLVEPGTNFDMWVDDTRENLPTMRLFLDIVGIGVGQADNNVDGLSTGSKQLGELVNKTIGWNKYIYKGRVLYVATTSVCGTVCWNDIAKREAAYGERTVRFGSRYYRIRMLSDTEYKVLLNDLSIADPEYQSLIEMQDYELLEDFQEGATRKVVKFNSKEYATTELDPKSRTCRYRPVLELIARGSEPFNHWSNGVKATNEEFRYDKFTDTGYFGEVTSENFISGDALCSKVGFTSGTSINSGVSWFKFYWHGIVMYVPKNSIRYSVSWNMIQTHRCHFGICMGNKDYHEVDVKGFKHRVSTLTGARSQPYDMTGINYDANGTTFLKSNWEKELVRYSMWEELMYRIQTGYVDMGTSDSSNWNNGRYRYWHAGPQKGDNWAENASVADLKMASGYGCGPMCREVTASLGANGNSVCAAQFGVSGHSGNHAISYQDRDSGFLPALKLQNNREREREFTFNVVHSQHLIPLYKYKDISYYWNAPANKYNFEQLLWCSYYEIPKKFDPKAAQFFIVRVKDPVRLWRTLDFIQKSTGRQDIGFDMNTEALEIITEIQPDDTFTDLYIRQWNSVDGGYNTRFVKHDKTGIEFPSNGANNTYCGLWYGNGFYYEYMKQQCQYYVLATSKSAAPSGNYHIQIVIK